MLSTVGTVLLIRLLNTPSVCGSNVSGVLFKKIPPIYVYHMYILFMCVSFGGGVKVNHYTNGFF